MQTKGDSERDPLFIHPSAGKKVRHAELFGVLPTLLAIFADIASEHLQSKRKIGSKKKTGTKAGVS